VTLVRYKYIGLIQQTLSKVFILTAVLDFCILSQNWNNLSSNYIEYVLTTGMGGDPL
jgi:hypothetical protein